MLDEGFNINFEYTPPGSPQYNGVVERDFPAIYGKVRATFNAAGIDEDKKLKLWTECASTICKLDNMSIKNDHTNKSPYEMIFNKTPTYANKLRTFGEMAIVRDIKQNIKSKLQNKGLEAIFIGYPDNHASDVYRFLILKTHKIVMSKDI